MLLGRGGKSLEGDEIRMQYPESWLLLEAIQAYSEGGKRIVEQLAVVEKFNDSVAAMKEYARLHREIPEKELYVFHTRRKSLEISERRWLGIRGLNES